MEKSLLIVVTGMSGAGRSTALKVLEDIGFEAVDNLPLPLLPRLALGLKEPNDPQNPGAPSDQTAPSTERPEPQSAGQNKDQKEGQKKRRPAHLAVGIDVRSRDFNPDLMAEEIRAIREMSGISVRTLFLDCEDVTLIRRYAETRRRHPLATDRPVADGLSLERGILSPLRDSADLVLDTTDLTIWDLKRRLTDAFGGTGETAMALTVTSFSFRRGLPREADIVFDVRFLRNPHYDADLRDLTGQDQRIGAYIEDDPDFDAFWTRVASLLEITLPRYASEGKSYLTIAFGCTGGKHRSVYLAETAKQWLEDHGWPATIMHRDLARDART